MCNESWKNISLSDALETAKRIWKTLSSSVKSCVACTHSATDSDDVGLPVTVNDSQMSSSNSQQKASFVGTAHKIGDE